MFVESVDGWQWNRDTDKGSEKGVGEWKVDHKQINASAGHERRLQGVRHGGMLNFSHLGVEIGGGVHNWTEEKGAFRERGGSILGLRPELKNQFTDWLSSQGWTQMPTETEQGTWMSKVRVTMWAFSDGHCLCTATEGSSGEPPWINLKTFSREIRNIYFSEISHLWNIRNWVGFFKSFLLKHIYIQKCTHI